MAVISALHRNYVWNGDKTMELSHQYVTVHRTNPKRMEHVIEKTTEDIKEIVFRYSNGINVSQSLLKDIAEMVRSYLYCNGVHDLFEVRIEEGGRGWVSSFIKSNVRFVYNKKKERKLIPGVSYHFYEEVKK